MKAFLYSTFLQWKLDLRNQEVFITCYLVPLVFFAFMGGIFGALTPDAKTTLIQSMTIFGVTMGAVLGAPVPLVEIYGSDIKKAYKVGGIPLWVTAATNFISVFIHLLIMSTIIFILAPILFNATIPENLLLYFISLGVFIVVCINIGTILGIFVKSTSKLTMLAQLIFLPSIVLSGIMLPPELLPSIFETVGKIFPATWAYKLLTTSTFNLDLFTPLIIFLILTISIIFIRLSMINKE